MKMEDADYAKFEKMGLKSVKPHFCWVPHEGSGLLRIDHVIEWEGPGRSRAILLYYRRRGSAAGVELLFAAMFYTN